MTERLTETFIRALKPPARGSRQIWDAELTGFTINIFVSTRAHPQGARTYVLSYWLNGTEIRFDSQDRAALAKLDDDFAINADGEVATISGKLEVEIMRLAGDGGDQFRLRFKFPSEPLDVRIRRVQLLEQLGVKDGGS